MVKAKEHKEKLIKLDGEVLAKEFQIGMHHVERAQKLGEEVDTLNYQKYGWERRLQLQKSKYQKMKESLPFWIGWIYLKCLSLSQFNSNVMTLKPVRP